MQAGDGQHPAGNRTFDLYRDIKQRFEPITRPETIIDTDRPFEQCVNMVLATIVWCRPGQASSIQFRGWPA